VSASVEKLEGVVESSVDLLKSRTSMVDKDEPSIDVVGTDCVIVDV
jgi:hypothetical protein